MNNLILKSSRCRNFVIAFILTANFACQKKSSHPSRLNITEEFATKVTKEVAEWDLQRGHYKLTYDYNGDSNFIVHLKDNAQVKYLTNFIGSAKGFEHVNIETAEKYRVVVQTMGKFSLAIEPIEDGKLPMEPMEGQGSFISDFFAIDKSSVKKIYIKCEKSTTFSYESFYTRIFSSAKTDVESFVHNSDCPYEGERILPFPKVGKFLLVVKIPPHSKRVIQVRDP